MVISDHSQADIKKACDKKKKEVLQQVLTLELGNCGRKEMIS